MYDARARLVLSTDEIDKLPETLRRMMLSQGVTLTQVANTNIRSRRQLDRYLQGDADIDIVKSFVQMINALGYDVAIVYPEQ